MLFGHNTWDAVTTEGFETNAPISDGITAPKVVSSGAHSMPIYVITEMDNEINGRKYMIDFSNAGKGPKSRAEISVASAKASAKNPPAGFGVPSGYWLDTTNPVEYTPDDSATDDGTTADVDEDIDDASDDGSEDDSDNTTQSSTGTAVSTEPSATTSGSKFPTKLLAIGGIVAIGGVAAMKMRKKPGM
jgi:hypothetical protein